MDNIVINMALLDEVEREACIESFYEFIQSFWGAIIKEDPVYNWHIKYLADELQKISYYIINRLPKPYDLIINIPPGTTKSTICTIMFPVWLWIQDPTIRIISNSYSSDLSIEHAVKSRDIIYSDKFRRIFPDVVLRKDKSAKSSYENTEGGARYSTSTGGTITGKHAHVVINDDPSNPKQASSEADRKAANEHTKTLSSRKVDKKNTPTIVIMQRLHESDVTGFLLSKKADKIKHICLPAELSDKVKPESLKTKYVNGLLDVNRLDKEVLIEAKQDLGSYGYANQYAQDSAPQEGGILKTHWFPIVDWKDEYSRLAWCTAIDSAYTEKLDNDESGMMQFAVTPNNELLIRYAEEAWLELPELVKYTVTFANAHGYTNKSMIYVEPKASGKSLVQTVKRNTTTNIKEDDNPLKDKVARANDISPICESGRVKVIRGAWNDTFFGQVKSFPNGNDGLIDCLVISANKIKKKKSGWGKSRTA